MGFQGTRLAEQPFLASQYILGLLEGPTVVKHILEICLCTFEPHSYSGVCCRLCCLHYKAVTFNFLLHIMKYTCNAVDP